MEEKLPNYGGQAVMEGVLMRGAHFAAIAMRAPSHEIVIQTEKLGAIYTSRWAKIPFLRGLVMLWDALGLGMRALTNSANLQTGEENKIEGPALYLTIGISLAFGIGLFFLLPAGIGQFSEVFLKLSDWWGNVIEGLLRLVFLVGYIWAVGFIPEIQRVFAYHGAEHKTINAFESGAEMTPESVARFPVEHPRCGTSFLLTLVLLSILFFSLLGPLPLFWRFASRILMIPILAGLAYEYIRWSARHMNLRIVRWLVRPNLALQGLTTRQPSPDMLEVAIAAFETMRKDEEALTV